MDANSKSFLGSGLAFPLQLNSRGEIALVSGDKDIEQAIRIILGTRPGERVMRPTFGCRAHELIFEPRGARTLTLLRDYVDEALKFWEPRIQVQRIDTHYDNGSDGSIIVDITYQVKETHDTRSIIYPFFLSSEEQAGQA